MPNMQIQRRVDAPPDRVWAIITDLESSPAVVSGIDSVEVLGDGSFGVGTAWRETRTMFGKSVTEEMRIVDVVEGSSYTVESRATGTTYRSVMSVEPDEGGTLLSMSFTAEAGSTISRAFSTTIGKLFEGGTRRALEQDLADIAAAAERSA